MHIFVIKSSLLFWEQLQEQFEAIRTEFRSEVELLAKIDHRNLVKLLGYVEKGNERLIITEYVPNGTLREHLDGKDFDTWATLPNSIHITVNNLMILVGIKNKILDFNQRLEISIDIAHGLTYLHLYAGNDSFYRH